MIHIVEIPHQRPPKAWSRETKEEIISVIDKVWERSGDTIYERASGRELLERFGCSTTDELRDEEGGQSLLADTLDKTGLDVMLYIDYRSVEYSAVPIDEWESYIDYNGHDLHCQLVYMDTEAAQEALKDDSVWRIHQGVEARYQLKKQLEEGAE